MIVCCARRSLREFVRAEARSVRHGAGQRAFAAAAARAVVLPERVKRPRQRGMTVGQARAQPAMRVHPSMGYGPGVLTPLASP